MATAHRTVNCGIRRAGVLIALAGAVISIAGCGGGGATTGSTNPTVETAAPKTTAIASILALTRKAARDIDAYEVKMKLYGPRNIETSMARNRALLDQMGAEEKCRAIPECKATLLDRIESMVETIRAMPR